MKILFIGRSTLNNGLLPEDYEIYKTFLELGADAYFENYPLSDTVYENLDWIFIAKIITKEDELKEIKDRFPNTKIAYWTPDYQIIEDTESGFQQMVRGVDLFIGNVQDRQLWFEKNNVPYLFWNEGLVHNISQKEYDITVTTRNPQTPYPNEVPIGFFGNWGHNPWRANVLREFQYEFGDEVLHINTVTFNEYRDRDGLRGLHYAVFGHWLNCLIAITKINLCMESMGNKGFWGGRIGQIMGAGGFALVWHCKNMERWFGQSGENVVYFYNVPDGIAKARYYLEHEEERQRIADRGYKFANENLRPLKTIGKLYEDLCSRCRPGKNN